MMTSKRQPTLVFGATGQQGGSVAAALVSAGWPVRALVRDPAAARAVALRRAGVELFGGDFDDVDAMRTSMRGAGQVFSVQPSSPGGTVSDEDEVRYGTTVAELAVESGVAHLVYSSGAAVRETPTGVGHFDSKAQIEAHVRTLPIAATIVRPASFMEMLLMPGFGLDQRRFTFFPHLDQTMQFIAVADIGRFVRAILTDRARFSGRTFEIAGDEVTGRELGTLFSEAAGHEIRYERFSDAVLKTNPFLARLMALMDAGILAGGADLEFLHGINPEMQSFRSWLFGDARAAFANALTIGGTWEYNRD